MSRKPSSSRHQTFDSNGPDTRVRGTAIQVYEKYMSLARDATSSSDRVMAENYYQHAEHYYRIIASFTEGQPYVPQHMQQRDAFEYEQDDERGQDDGEAGSPDQTITDAPQPDLQTGELPRETARSDMARSDIGRADIGRAEGARSDGGRYESERREPRRDFRNEGRNDPRNEGRGDYANREPRGDFNRGDQRGEFNRGEPRPEYNRGEPRGESRGEYTRNEPRAEYRGDRRPDPRNQDPRNQDPRNQDPRNQDPRTQDSRTQDQRGEPRQEGRQETGDYNEHPAFLRQPARRPRDEQEPRPDSRPDTRSDTRDPRNDGRLDNNRSDNRGRGRSYQGGYEPQPYEQPVAPANLGPVMVITPAGGGLPPRDPPAPLPVTAPVTLAAPPPVVVEAFVPPAAPLPPAPVIVPILAASLPLDLLAPAASADTPTEPPKRKRGRPPKIKPPIEA